MMRLLAGLGLLVVCSAAYADAKKSDVLYVGKFDAKGVAQDEASTVETTVCTAASQDGRFVVKCRDTSGQVLQLRQAQMELGFGEGAEGKDDCGKEGCIGAAGSATDAKWILGGSIAKIAEKQYLLTLLVVDPKSNAQLNRVEEKVSGELSAVVDRVPGAVRRVLTPPQASKPAAQPAPAPAPKK